MAFVNIHGYSPTTQIWEPITVSPTSGLITSKSTNTQGYFGDLLLDGTLTPGQETAPMDVSTFTDSIISYTDSSPTNVGGISIYGTASASLPYNWIFLGKLVPVSNGANTKRESVANIRLSPIKLLICKNDSGTETVNNVNITVLSN